ncbi:MAG: hypothetical protein WC935_07235 [Thermoleophilia bacterium]
MMKTALGILTLVILCPTHLPAELVFEQWEAALSERDPGFRQAQETSLQELQSGLATRNSWLLTPRAL